MPTLSREQRRLLERATLQYQEHLPVAEGYLAGRGISLEFARSSGLGVVADPVPGHEARVGRLAIPYLTDAGPVNMTFRCIRDHNCHTSGCKKYLMSEGFKTNLYSVQSLGWASDWIAITEGEIDALSLNSIRVPAVGVSGAEKWQDHWENVFEDYSRIYVFTDGDDPGKKFGKEMARKLNAIVIDMPDGEDVNSMLVKQGAEYLRGRIRK